MTSSSGLATYLESAQLLMERVHDGLGRDFPQAKREIGATAQALHDIRNARTIVLLNGDQPKEPKT